MSQYIYQSSIRTVSASLLLVSQISKLIQISQLEFYILYMKLIHPHRSVCRVFHYHSKIEEQF